MVEPTLQTQAADVGADLVGKVESDIPEDDPRNPATIADNVGDNVGDVAGMGADLFESFVGSIIAAATLADTPRELALPFWVAGFGIAAAAIGFFIVQTKDDATQSELLHAIHSGMYLASVLVVGLSAVAVHVLFVDDDGDYSHNYISFRAMRNGTDCKARSYVDGCKTENKAWMYFGCIIIGLVAGILIGEATEFFTSYAYTPTQSITKAGSRGGAATVIIQGLGVGMLSAVAPTLVIVAATIACYELGDVYGISIAAVGMLSTLGVTRRASPPGRWCGRDLRVSVGERLRKRQAGCVKAHAVDDGVPARRLRRARHVGVPVRARRRPRPRFRPRRQSRRRRRRLGRRRRAWHQARAEERFGGLRAPRSCLLARLMPMGSRPASSRRALTASSRLPGCPRLSGWAGAEPERAQRNNPPRALELQFGRRTGLCLCGRRAGPTGACTHTRLARPPCIQKGPKGERTMIVPP